MRYLAEWAPKVKSEGIDIALISVIIPHAGGAEMLKECLTSLQQNREVEWEAIIVENGSHESPHQWGAQDDPRVQVLHFDQPLGFATSCNRGVQVAKGDVLFLLNNDAVLEPTTLKLLSEPWTKGHPSGGDKIAATAPKILSYQDHSRFDYSSAAGGFIDRYGFPFARGRIFDTIEEDKGQYDQPTPIFWGAGCALMIAKDLYLQAGGLEETFFAHMEEIDLLWRLRLMGYQVWSLPHSRVYHRGAATIRQGSFVKLYLNFRNSLLMLLRNWGWSELIRVLPIRLIIDLGGGIKSLLTGRIKTFGAIVKAWGWVLTHIPFVLKSRKQIQELRRLSDREIKSLILPRSIAWEYYIKGKRTFSELNFSPQSGFFS